MIQRVLTSLVAIPLALIVVAWPGGVPAVIVTAVIMMLAFTEYHAMCARAGVPCRLWWGALGVLLLVIWSQGHMDVPSSLPDLGLLAFWIMLIVETGRPGRRPVAAVGSTLVGLGWVGVLGSCFIRLRFLSPAAGFHAFHLDSGAWFIAGLLVIVWSLDIGAYVVGKNWGKVPLAPTISPHKTMEGTVAGFFAAAIAGMLVAPLMGHGLREGLEMGAMIGVIGQVGDLFESAVKRELGVKDSGSALPGHGGWLDRIDSLLFASGFVLWWVTRLGG